MIDNKVVYVSKAHRDNICKKNNMENIVEPGKSQMTICRTRIACYITKRTNTLTICNT